MSAINVLNCAAALMDLRWHSNDGPGHLWGDKPLCALEAIALADGRSREDWSVPSPHGTTAVQALAEAIGEPPPGYFDFEDADAHSVNCVIVYCYNDRPERTKAEMTSCMRTAAAMLKAREPSEEAVCA
jgi:hypothetical protein